MLKLERWVKWIMHSAPVAMMGVFFILFMGQTIRRNFFVSNTSRTSNLRNSIRTQIHFILGQHVRIGQQYSNCYALNRYIDPSVYIAIHYDSGERILALKAKGAERYVLLSGDVAVWRGAILAEKVYCTISLAEPAIETLKQYATRKGIAKMTQADIDAAMVERWPRIPVRSWNFVGQRREQHIRDIWRKTKLRRM